MDYIDNLEIAIIYKGVITKEVIPGRCFVPCDVIEGFYCEDDECFYDLDGTAYKHLITNPENIGYVNRINLNKIITKRTNHNKEKVFKKLLKDNKNNIYFLLDKNINSLKMPVLVYPDNKEICVFNDTDTHLYYINHFYNEYSKIDWSKNDVTITIESKNNKDLLNDDLINETDDIKININISDLYKKITDVVIDQDEPIKKVLTAIWKQNNNFSNKSRNILINGGTGVGKTEIFRILSKIIDVPCVITSATEYSATGYVGKNVEDMLVSLVNRANGDIDSAERGILIIDEVDKIAETDKGHSQVNQRSVQENLLKILEDGVIYIDTEYGYFDFDTSKLMVIAMGSWTMANIDEKKDIGFNSKEVVKKDYKAITREQMIENGLIPDFVGRFNTIIQMNDLNYESFIRILKQSKNSLLKINQKFLKDKGVTLTIEDGTYETIAKKAEKSKFGARELDSIIEYALSNASFEIATNPDKYSELIINKDTVEDNKKYKLVLKNKNTCIK